MDEPDNTNLNTDDAEDQSLDDDEEDGPSCTLTDRTRKDKSTRVEKNHPSTNTIGDPSTRIRTRNRLRSNLVELTEYSCYTSKVEPKNVKEALQDDLWIKPIQEELGQFERNHVWDLVPRPEGVNIIGTKWIFKNKIDEAGNVARNKARLVAQGYTQLEGIDYDETFAPVVRLE